ncbi:MAG: hypothetical protein WCQ26_00765 [Pseudanabaena sp. ELA748]
MDIAIALLQHYSFDLGGYTIQDLTRAWADFRPEWVRQAVIEALFQGRYKAVSVTQILYCWERKGEPNYRHNHEFERLVCADVAVIYQDRIYYTPPRNRETAIAEIPVFKAIKEEPPQVKFPRRSMLGALKPVQTFPQVSQNTQANEVKTKTQKYPSRSTEPLGTTKPATVYPVAPKVEYSPAYLSAYANMALLAETSMFVDKLRSMCGDQPDPHVADTNNQVKEYLEV